MSLETRARAAADGLRTATDVDVDAGLARLRRTHRHRNATRVAGAALAVACVVVGGALVLDGIDRTAPPVDPVDDLDGIPAGGLVVHAGEAEIPRTPSELGVLREAGTASYPAWQAFDQEAGWFLFTRDELPEMVEDPVEILVRDPGRDTPVAAIRCTAGPCGYMPSFGPGPDEVTSLFGAGESQPTLAQVTGFDSEVRQEIDLSAVLGQGRGVSDLEWSPDGSQLAVATFEGAYEPTCKTVPNEARVYLFGAAGGDPVLVHRRQAQPGVQGEPPVLNDLAWSPDGERLGLVSSTYCRNGLPQAATLVALDVASGEAEALHQFDGNHDYANATLGFAWSPDGTRIAVTSGAEIAELSSDGERITQTEDSGPGPLAWLAPPND